MIIVGKGGHARQCAEFAPDPVLMESHEIEIYPMGVYFTIGFGSLDNPVIRQKEFDRIEASGKVPETIIHPAAWVSPGARIGMGVQIHAGAIVHNGALISRNCIINTGAIVSHDCFLDENVHLTPGATLAGNVRIGKNSIIGMNATVYMGVQLPENTVILNGQHVKAYNRKIYFVR